MRKSEYSIYDQHKLQTNIHLLHQHTFKFRAATHNCFGTDMNRYQGLHAHTSFFSFFHTQDKRESKNGENQLIQQTTTRDKEWQPETKMTTKNKWKFNRKKSSKWEFILRKTTNKLTVQYRQQLCSTTSKLQFEPCLAHIILVHSLYAMDKLDHYTQ